MSASLWAFGIVSAADVTAQSFRLTKVERPDVGLEMRSLRSLQDVALDPKERQILVTWRGVEKAKVDRDEVEVDLALSYFVIDKQAEFRDSGTPTEVQNGAIDLRDFLIRRGFEDPDDPRVTKVEFEKPIKLDKVSEFQSWELRKDRRLRMRVWFIESEAEVWGLMATSKVDVEPFVETIEDKLLKSIVRTAPEQVEFEDPYVGSDLPYLDDRRAKLVDLPRSWRHLDTPNFLILTGIGARGKAGELVETIAKDLEIMREEFMARFPPTQKLDKLATVRVFESFDAYQAYGAPQGTGGYWDPSKLELVLPNPAERVRDPLSYRKGQSAFATLYHEAMHQYFSYACPGVTPASWFNEGYGDYFGGARLDRRAGAVEEIAISKERWDMVGLQVKNDAVPPLAELLQMSQPEFYGRFAASNYAFAWSFCFFLEQMRKKGDDGNAQYAQIPTSYLENLRIASGRNSSGDAAHAEAYSATFGGFDMAKLQADWLAEMKTWKDPK